jgi:hypothetical protein
MKPLILLRQGRRKRVDLNILVGFGFVGKYELNNPRIDARAESAQVVSRVRSSGGS